jgi:hypothetical protein
LLTETVHDAAGIAEILAPYRVNRIEAELKGISATVPVYCVRGPQS